MSDEALCKLGREPKILSFIDEKQKKYVQMNCKLKDEISTIQLHYFFNRIYSMKLDMGYANAFEGKYSTSDLIKCFKSILIEHEVINLQEIYAILNKGTKCSWTSAKLAIEEFFNMFEVVQIKYYPILEYTTEPKEPNNILLFQTQENNFSKEIEALKYNSQFIKVEEIENPKSIETAETKKEQTRKLSKIRIKKLNPNSNRKIS